MNAVLDRNPGLRTEFGGASSISKAKKKKFDRFNALARSSEMPIRPERIVRALQKSLPDDAVIVSDPGTSCPYMSAYYRCKRPGRHFVTNRAHGALGYSIGASMGVWFGRPDRKVVAVMGDGSFGFACGELETVSRIRAPITFVVFSNSSFGWIRASQYADCGKRYHNVDFDRTDHAAIAASYGLKSWRVEDPEDLDGALQKAIECGEPTLVDVICQPLEEAAAPVRRWMG